MPAKTIPLQVLISFNIDALPGDFYISKDNIF